MLPAATDTVVIAAGAALAAAMIGWTQASTPAADTNDEEHAEAAASPQAEADRSRRWA